MRNFLLAVLAYFLIGPVFADPAVDAWAAHKCATVWKGTWQKVRDDEADAIAREFFAKAGIAATPIICSGRNEPLEFVANARVTREGRDYFFLFLHAEFRLAIGDEIRGVIAHEVGHWIAPRGDNCNLYFDFGLVDEYITCEHEVDMEGEKLAGVGSVPRALRWVLAYGEKVAFEMGDSRPNFHNLRKRIALLQ